MRVILSDARSTLMTFKQETKQSLEKHRICLTKNIFTVKITFLSQLNKAH